MLETVGYVMLLIAAAPAFAFETPGETFPRNVEISIGASVNISCRINLDKHPKMFPGRNASNLYFINLATKERVPDSNILVLNSTTIIFMLRNAPEQKSNFLCKCDSDAIMDTKVYVGTPPKPVRDFNCLYYDFDYMICKFVQPPNWVLTKYNLFFYTNSPEYKFDVTSDCNYEKPFEICNITKTHFRESCAFTLYSQNSLGYFIENFTVNTLKVMVPAIPRESFREINRTTDSVLVAWRMPKWESYPKWQSLLQWSILLEPENMPIRNLSGQVQIYFQRSELQLHLHEIPYAFYNYELHLRVKVRSSAYTSIMWSEPIIYQFQTLARQPLRPPRTNVGSFYVNSSETHVRLYWEQLEPYEYNGANFTYVFKLWKNGQLSSLQPLLMDTNSAVFEFNKDFDYSYVISSQNHMGESREASEIQIHRMNSRNAKLCKPRSIHNVYHATNRTYTLTWEPPVQFNDLIDYTVYWCHSKRAMQTECKGSIHFQQLSRETKKFATEPQSAQQEHTLNLAVSANYLKYNSGMHWTSCTVDENSDLVKMEPEVQPVSSTIMRVQWSSESICPSILEGYNLTYCEVATNQNDHNMTAENNVCVENSMHALKIDKNVKKYEVSHLKPFTVYKIEMFMYSRRKVGRVSEPLLVRTYEAAPSPPRQLQVSKVKNTSATISWLPPSQPNGKIRSYILKLPHNDREIPVTGDSNSSERIVYVLYNLTSFTDYKVFVIAKTIESSDHSNDIHFTTLIGYPSMVSNIIPVPDSYSNTIIQWTKPLKRGGRLEFYEVAVTKFLRENIVDRRINVIFNSTSCLLKVPACTNNEQKTTVEVRAVNAALLTHEVDVNTEWNVIDVDEDRDEGNDDLICASYDGNHADYTEYLQRYRNGSLYRLYKSPWQTGTTYGCAAPQSKSAVIALAVIPISFVLACFAYLAVKKYKKMSKIACTLPAGLDLYLAKGIILHDEFLSIPEKEGSKPQKVKESINEKHHLLSSLGSDSGFLGETGRTPNGNISSISTEETHINTIGCQRTSSESSIESLVKVNNDNVSHTIVSSDHNKDVDKHTRKTYVASNTTYFQPLSSPFDYDNGYIKPSNINNWQQGVNINVPTQTIDINNDYVSADAIIKTTPLNVEVYSRGYVRPTEMQRISPSTLPSTTPTHNTTSMRNLDGYTTLEELEKITPIANTSNEMVSTSINTPGIFGYVTPRELTAFGHQYQH